MLIVSLLCLYHSPEKSIVLVLSFSGLAVCEVLGCEVTAAAILDNGRASVSLMLRDLNLDLVPFRTILIVPECFTGKCQVVLMIFGVSGTCSPPAKTAPELSSKQA